MEKMEMFDANVLMIHGLMDNPMIIAMETHRLAREEKRKEIKAMVERLMGADQDLDDLLAAVTMMHEKEEAA